MLFRCRACALRLSTTCRYTAKSTRGWCQLQNWDNLRIKLCSRNVHFLSCRYLDNNKFGPIAADSDIEKCCGPHESSKPTISYTARSTFCRPARERRFATFANLHSSWNCLQHVRGCPGTLLGRFSWRFSWQFFGTVPGTLTFIQAPFQPRRRLPSVALLAILNPSSRPRPSPPQAKPPH